MSNEDDWCYQCQEPGHITQHWPHIRCLECKEYGHIVMDCPNKIPPLGTPAQHCKVHRNYYTRPSSRHHEVDQERRDRSRSQSRYSRHWNSRWHGLYRGHSRSQQRDGHRCYRSSSRWSHSAHQGNSCRNSYDTPHWPHCHTIHTLQLIWLPLSGPQEVTFTFILQIITIYSRPQRITQFKIILQRRDPKITP